jgi:hypothetical protein
MNIYSNKQNVPIFLTSYIIMQGLGIHIYLFSHMLQCTHMYNSYNHLPVHDPSYVVFLKEVTCWYLRHQTDLHPQHNPTTRTD